MGLRVEKIEAGKLSDKNQACINVICLTDYYDTRTETTNKTISFAMLNGNIVEANSLITPLTKLTPLSTHDLLTREKEFTDIVTKAFYPETRPKMSFSTSLSTTLENLIYKENIRNGYGVKARFL